MTIVTGTDASELLEGTAASDTLSGGGGADTLTGGLGADRLDGGVGDDRLFGHGGDDTLMGGQGDDSLFAAFGDVVDGGAGFDRASIGPSPAFSMGPVSFTVSGTTALYAQGDAVSILTHVEAFIVSGGAGDDVLSGGVHGDWLGGGAGDDTLTGGADADTLAGGSGADVFAGSAEGLSGDTIVDLDAGDRILVEGADAATRAVYDGDALTITLGGDTVEIDVADDLAGAFANDGTGAIVYTPLDAGPSVMTGRIDGAGTASAGERMGGTDGADTLRGGAGADSLTAGDDDDALFGGAGDDRLFGGYGNDLQIGGQGDDVLGGGAGDDVLAGGSGYDVVYGAEGDDTVFAAGGADTVYGGLGDDVIFLGRDDGARDVYASVSENGSDTLYGFETGTDALDLTASGITSTSELASRVGRNAEDDATIDLGDGDVLTLDGVDQASLIGLNVLF